MGFGKFLKKIARPLTSPVKATGQLLKGDVKGSLKTAVGGAISPLTDPAAALIQSNRKLFKGDLKGAVGAALPGNIPGASEALPPPGFGGPHSDPYENWKQMRQQGPPPVANFAPPPVANFAPPPAGLPGVGVPGVAPPPPPPAAFPNPAVAALGAFGGGLKSGFDPLNPAGVTNPSGIIGRGRLPRNSSSGGFRRF